MARPHTELVYMLTTLTTTATSTRYGRVDTAFVVSMVTDILAARGLSYQVRTISRGRSSRHLTRIEVTNLPGAEALGGLLPSIDIINSYRGETSLVFAVGITRLVCSNGLRVGSNFFEARVRHVRGPRLSSWLEGLPEVATRAVDAALSIVDEARRLSGIHLPTDSALRVVASLGEAGVLSARQVKAAQSSLMVPRRDEDRGESVWTAWNIINEARRGARTVSSTSLASDPEIHAALLAAA